VMQKPIFNQESCRCLCGFRIYRETLSRFRAPLQRANDRIDSYIAYQILVIEYVNYIGLHDQLLHIWKSN
ncbi:hypothetical protein Q8W17_23105, partial [Photobacterium damselae subsp. piscicida]|nr:hypothetical protein [Photobacterium damselae subsp. piscicida]